MKKLRILTLLLAVLLLFSSCSAGETELKHRLIIEGIGIDYDKESKNYDLTVQVLSTAQSGGSENSGSGGSSSPVINYKVSKKTIAEAINSLCDTTGKNMLYSQNRIIVLGSDLTGHQVIKSLDYFVREYTARSDVSVAAASGKAEDILLNNDGSGEIPSKIIEQSIEESYNNSISVNTELYKTINLYKEETSTFTMPLLEVTKDRNSSAPTVKVTGTYVFEPEDKINRLSEEETMFLQFASGDAVKGTFSLQNNEDVIAVDIIKTKTQTKVSIKDSLPEYSIKIKCTIDIIEFSGEGFGSFKEEDVSKVKKMAEIYIKDGTQRLLKRELNSENTDIVRFGRQLMQKDSELYKKLSKDWKKTLEKIKFSVSADVTVRRIGQETLKS